MYLRLNTNNSCNLDCKHCYYKKKVWFNWESMPLEMAKNIINQAHEIFKNNLNVVLMWGWEPFLYKYIFELINFLKEKNINTSITTNAILLDEEKLLKLKDAWVLLNISIEWKQNYNDFIRWKWTFKKILKNILLAHKIWTRISVNFTLTKNNILEIPYLINLLKDKVEYITFSRYIPYIKNDDIKELDKKDYLILDEILNIYKDSKLKHRQENFLNKKINLNKNYKFDIQNLKSLYILPNWKIYPAWNLIDYEIWDINKNSLLEILNNKKLEELYNPDNLNWTFCNNCKYKYNCIWDRWVALFYTNNIFWDDIQCPFYKSKKEK